MKSRTIMYIAIIDTSAIMKFLHRNENNESKDIHVQRVWQIIEDLNKDYAIVIIPQTAIDELNDATEETKRQILRNILSKYNIIVKHYSSDDIFEVAQNAVIEFGREVEIVTWDTHVGTRIRYHIE